MRKFQLSALSLSKEEEEEAAHSFLWQVFTTLTCNCSTMTGRTMSLFSMYFVCCHGDISLSLSLSVCLSVQLVPRITQCLCLHMWAIKWAECVSETILCLADELFRTSEGMSCLHRRLLGLGDN